MIFILIFLAVAVWRTFGVAKKNGYNAINWSIAAGIVFFLTQVIYTVISEMAFYRSISDERVDSRKALLIVSLGLILGFVVVWLTIHRRIENPRSDEITAPPAPPKFG